MGGQKDKVSYKADVQWSFKENERKIKRYSKPPYVA